MNLWRFKRQLVGIILFSLITIAIVGSIIYFFVTSGTCTDGRLNQGEERADCGGPCDPCIDPNPKPPLILWNRLFEIHPQVYDVAALLKNTNQLGGGNVPYHIKLFDSSGVLLTDRQGSIYLYPNEERLLLVSNFSTGARKSDRVSIEFDDVAWKFAIKPEIRARVARREFISEPQPRVEAVVANETIREIGKFILSVTLQDEDGTVYAASQTTIDRIPGSGESPATFSWPSLPRSPARITFFINPLPISDSEAQSLP